MPANVVAGTYRDRLLAITLHLREVEANAPADASTRSQILATAISLFTRKGYAGTSMREIAAQVGIKAASLYAHCPEGKEQLLRLSLHSILAEFLAFITQPIRFEMDPAEQLWTLVSRHIRWQLETADQALAWDAAINQFGVVGVLDDDALASIRAEQNLYHGYLEALVATAAADPLSAADTATALRIMCDQAAAWAADPRDPAADVEGIIARIRALGERLLVPVKG